jgi:hypothetical protein
LSTVRRRRDDWEDNEHGLAFAREEAGRLFRRGRARVVWLLLGGLLLASAYSYRKATAKRFYDSQIVFRIVEADKELTHEVRPPSQYADYIWRVFLSSSNLKKVIEDDKLYPDKWDRDPQLAVEAMRNDLDVLVWGNYFIDTYYSNDDEARSVRVSIMWKHRDSEVALKVVKKLAQIIMDAQAESRRIVYDDAKIDVKEAADLEFERLVALRSALARATLARERAPAAARAALLVQMNVLQLQIKATEQRVDEVSNARARLDVSARVERNQSGLRFELIEPGVVVPEHHAGPIALSGTFVLITVLTVLLGGVVIGAFETRIRHPADVQRLGLPILGTLPPFPGDGLGALTERLRAEDRLRLENR